MYEVTATVPAKDDATEKNLLQYASSQGDAAGKKRDMLEKYRDAGLKRSAITIEEVDVPTSKAGLIDWLNEQFGEA
jgi:hypothetical protein